MSITYGMAYAEAVYAQLVSPASEGHQQHLSDRVALEGRVCVCVCW